MSRREYDEPDMAEEPVEVEPPRVMSQSDYYKGQTSKERRRTTCCMICLCCICLGLAIALCVVFANIYKEQEIYEQEQELLETENPTAAPTKTPLGGSKADVNRLCSKEALSLDFEACFDFCKGFECCDPYLLGRDGCFYSDRQGCLNFARCHVTNLRISAPPENLYEVCSEQSVARDPNDCITACASAECCWSEETSCADTDFFACVDYAPCQNLRSGSSLVPVPDDAIYSACAGQGGDTCTNLCQPGSCCWATDRQTCLQDNFFTCLAYNQCDGRIDIPRAGSADVPKPTTDVTEACSFIGDGDTTGCDAACQPGSCCSNSGILSCFDSDPLTCLQYDACKVL